MPIILHHHERFAGHGYPYGLRANEIPLGARIVAIADAYDAMTHDRPYKRAMSHDAAIVELKQHAGTQFDPELVALFCDLYADHAPTPDPTILAITNPAADARSSGGSAAARAARSASSRTMAADGHGLVDLGRRRDPALDRDAHGDGPRARQARDRGRLIVRGLSSAAR